MIGTFTTLFKVAVKRNAAKPSCTQKKNNLILLVGPVRLNRVMNRGPAVTPGFAERPSSTAMLKMRIQQRIQILSLTKMMNMKVCCHLALKLGKAFICEIALLLFLFQRYSF